jgi:hypothetical protein
LKLLPVTNVPNKTRSFVLSKLKKIVQWADLGMQTLRQTIVFPYALYFFYNNYWTPEMYWKISGSGTDPCVKHSRTLPPTARLVIVE